MRWVLLPTLPLLLAGCPPSQSEVVAVRAAHDFQCGEHDIKVENIGGGSWEAKGCGRTQTYNCVGGMTAFKGPALADPVMCQPEGSAPPPQQAPSTAPSNVAPSNASLSTPQ